MNSSRQTPEKLSESAAVACVVSHRLGGFDGVSVEASKWVRALEALGWSVRRVAGHFVDAPRPQDVVLDGLWAPTYGGQPPPVNTAGIRQLCATSDLVILDNVGSLWTTPIAAKAWERELLTTRTPAIVRHHDPPWQITPPASNADASGLPLHHPRMLHVTINKTTYDEFAARWPELERSGALSIVHNTVDIAALNAGDRHAIRSRMRINHDEFLVAHPARNIPRKRVDIGLAITQALSRPDRPVHYWLTDPQGTIEEPLASAVRIHRGHVKSPADLYAAADLIVLPSTWEGWGLPVVEAAAARRPIVAGPYPILDEIRAAGLAIFSPEDMPLLDATLRDKPALDRLLDNNYTTAANRFAITDLPRRLAHQIDQARALA